jgi:hypothetical protein
VGEVLKFESSKVLVTEGENIQYPTSTSAKASSFAKATEDRTADRRNVQYPVKHLTLNAEIESQMRGQLCGVKSRVDIIFHFACFNHHRH